jgi:type II secretion system protein H
MTSATGSDPRRHGAEAGFTLVELLVVTLILAVVVGICVPQFRSTFRHLQLQVTASDVATLLTYASRRAVTRGEMVRIHFDADGRRYWLARADEAASAVAFEKISGKFGRVATVPGPISLAPSTRDVTFYPDGRADRFEMLIVDDSQAGYRLVTDARTGRVNLSERHGRTVR